MQITNISRNKSIYAIKPQARVLWFRENRKFLWVVQKNFILDTVICDLILPISNKKSNQKLYKSNRLSQKIEKKRYWLRNVPRDKLSPGRNADRNWKIKNDTRRKCKTPLSYHSIYTFPIRIYNISYRLFLLFSLNK